jgi:hypothetical protein
MPRAGSHPLEQPGVTAADFELLVVALHGHDLTAAEIARHTGNALHVDQRAAVDPPEQLRVDLVDPFLDGFPD